MAFDPSMADEKGTMGGAVAPADSPTYDPHPPKGETHLINASGHIQELSRHFSLWSLCGIAITTGNTWTAIGGSIAVAIYNGGPPGVLYEFIAVSVFYWLIAASIAELASSIPSSAGVYHWASIVSGPRKGRVAGFLAGWWNFLAWIFGAASMSAICGNQTVAMYALLHPEFVPQAWHVFVSYLLNTWLCCAIVLFFNRGLPKVGHAGGILILVGVLVTIVVCAVVPSKQGVEEGGYATGEQVWREWSNGTGWESDGFVFVAGMLNGAFAVGSVDCVTHLAEEIPRPSRNIPKAMAAQYVIGFITALLYLIAIFYSIHDLPTALSLVPTFPLAGIYMQATGSPGGALGLMIVVFLPTFITCIGCYITAGRTFWTLSRDNATPYSAVWSRVSKKWGNPFNATLLCGAVCTVMGCIYVGSTTAFNAFVGSYIILSTLSYLAAILPHLLSGRSRITPGWFWMKGMLGFVVNGIVCAYIVVFIVIFCFPYAMPVSAASMNYSCLITGGLTIFVAGWWLWRCKEYEGPGVVRVEEGMLAEDAR